MPKGNKKPDKGKINRIEKGSKSVTTTSISKPPSPPKQPSKND